MQLSTGEQITDLSTFGGIKKDRQQFDVFGKAGEEAEVIKP